MNTEREFEIKGKLVGPEQLLDAVFREDCRPTTRWLRDQMRAGVVPYFQIGGGVFFDVEMVRAALVEKHLINKQAVVSGK
jgi:hypothetical protein